MKNKKITFLVALLTISLSFSACHYDKGEEVYPAQPCSITSVSYATDIVGILNSNCYRCHSAGSLSSGIPLDQYTELKKYVIGTDLLLNDIQQTPGANFMPQDGGKLSACDIAKIKFWINAGAPRN